MPRSNVIGFDSPGNGAGAIACLLICFLGILVSLATPMDVEMCHCMGVLDFGHHISMRV